MSDYNPNSYDKYGNQNLNGPNGPMLEPNDPGGKGPYVLLAILVLIGLVGGLLYFNGTPKTGNEQAQAPASVTRTMPSTPASPSPASPAAPGTTTTTNPPADATK